MNKGKVETEEEGAPWGVFWLGVFIGVFSVIGVNWLFSDAESSDIDYETPRLRSQVNELSEKVEKLDSALARITCTSKGGTYIKGGARVENSSVYFSTTACHKNKERYQWSGEEWTLVKTEEKTLE